MSTEKDLWNQLADKEFRKRFVEALAKRAFATQVRTIRKKREWSQEKLAKEAEITQGVVSRTEDPNLGTTFDTAAEVAYGLGLAFIPKIVSFSEFMKWADEVSAGFTDLPSFEEEKADIDACHQLQGQSLYTQKKPPSKATDEAGSGYRFNRSNDMAEQFTSGTSEREDDLARFASGR